MYITRESVMTALFTLLQGMDGIKTFSRRFKTFSGVSMSAQMPYLILCSSKEYYSPRVTQALPAKRLINAEIFIWLSAGQDQNAVPDIVVNNLLDSLDEILAPLPGYDTQTLGGLVDHCYIEGEIMKVPGDVDGLGMLIIPLKILLP